MEGIFTEVLFLKALLTKGFNHLVAARYSVAIQQVFQAVKSDLVKTPVKQALVAYYRITKACFRVPLKR